MMQTVEAEINVEGTVALLEPIRVKVKMRALMTILDEEPERQLPTNKSVSDEKVLGTWAACAESGQEIVRDIRERNRKTR